VIFYVLVLFYRKVYKHIVLYSIVMDITTICVNRETVRLLKARYPYVRSNDLRIRLLLGCGSGITVSDVGVVE
jgi:hypothetical protein